jgi:asparagine synthase (glutamine-hydrolysing)
MHTYNLLAHIGMREVLSKALLASVDTEEPEKQQHAVWEGLPQASLVNRMLAYDWRFTLGENDLPKVVQTAQLAGLDVGFPLLDDRLVAFSMRLPTADKLKGLRLRWFFKEALRGFLPDAILSKKKHGFGLPFGVWLMRHAGLQALSRDALDGLERRGIVEPAFVARLFSAHLPTHPGYYGEMVWILVMLELWLRARAPAFTLRG